MSTTASFPDPAGEPTRDEMLAALFADLVLRQANLAQMFLGQAPHPQTQERTVDLEAAQMFIDQLEMLEVKTRGNLSKPEEALLKQALTQLRMLFVQVSEHGPASPAPDKPPTAPPPCTTPAPAPATPPPPEDPKVKFSKKY